MKKLLILVLFLGLSACNYSKEAEQAARTHFTKLGVSIAGVSCVNMDSDGDGYVSCTGASADGKQFPVECAVGFTLNSGCRAPKFSGNLGSQP